MLSVKKTVTFLILTALILSSVVVSGAASSPEINAVSVILAEYGSDIILYEKNADIRRPPDSLSKLLTVLIIAEMYEKGELDIDEMVTMTNSAWFDITSTSSTQSIYPGEEMSVIDLMNSAFLGSANEACNMLAIHASGSVVDFVELMNEYVKNIGCTNTRFVNTHGQYVDSQYTTAADQYLVYRRVIANPLLSEIIDTHRYYTSPTNKSGERRLTNPNHMINPDSKYYYSPCTGGRPSATYEGGYSMASSAEKDDMTLVSIILGSDAIVLEDESTLMRNLSESRRLFEWGFSEFGWRTLLDENELVAKAPVTYGDGSDYINLRPQSSIVVFIETSIDSGEFLRDVTVYSVENSERLYAPIKEGDVLGEISVKRGDKFYGTIKLIANTDVSLHRIEYIKSQIKSVLSSPAVRTLIAVLFVLLVVYILAVIRYNKRRKLRLRREAEARRRIVAERQRKSLEETRNSRR